MKKLLVVGLIVIALLLLTVPSVSATWCNSDYGKKAPILINNTGGSAQTYYQVELNFTHDSDMNANFSDIRVYNESDCSLVPLWNESAVASSWNQIWFNATNIPVSSWTNSTYYLYYNYSSASSVSNGTTTFEFFDDFETGNLEGEITNPWTRNASNPIFVKNATSSWDSYFVNSPFICLYLNGTPYQDASNNYFMYYSGSGHNDGFNNDQIGLALSTDLYSWTRYGVDGGRVIPFGNGTFENGDWDDADTQLGTFLYNSSDALFHAWYAGNNNHASDFVRIGYANSTDGKVWTKYGSNPILSQGSGDDNEDLYDPMVIWDSDANKWKMWYIGQRTSDHTFGLMYATADNPEGPWTRYSNDWVFQPTWGNLFCPSVWKDGTNDYHLIFINMEALPWEMHHATSTDGISWTYDGPIFHKGESGQWDDERVQYVSQINVSGTWYSYYTGKNTSNSDFGIGVATSSIRVPTPAVSKWDDIGAAWSVQNTVKYGGTYAAKGTYSAVSAAEQTLGKNWAHTSGVISMRYRPESIGTAFYPLSPLDSSGTLYWVVAYQGHYQYYDGSYHYFPVDTLYVLNRWDLIEVAFDYSTDKYHVWINGTKISGAGLTIVGADTELVSFRTMTYNTATDVNYLDNYLVRKYASTESIAQLGTEESPPVPTYIPPDPTNLQNTTGNFWVNYTWDAGSGNVTNSYNVSNQTEWFNGTTNTYYNESVSASEWVNITVYAWNSSGSGTLSVGSVSDQVQVSAADTTFTVSLPIGYTKPVFEPPNSTATNYPPNGQTDSQEFFNVTNSGNVNLDVRMRLNTTVSTITLKADSDNNPSGAKEVNTTMVTIYSGLGQGSTVNLWLWSDFDHTLAQTANRTVYINVSQS